MACALRSFCDYGFAQTTIERVAADCGTTRRSVLHRFPDKDSLLLAAGESHIEQSLAVLHASLRFADPEPMEALRDGCRQLLNLALRPATIAFFRVAINEAARIPALSARLIWSSDEFERAYQRLLLSAQDAGTFQRHSASTLATALVGTFLSNPLNRAALGDPLLREEHHVEIYFSQAWSVFLAAA